MNTLKLIQTHQPVFHLRKNQSFIYEKINLRKKCANLCFTEHTFLSKLWLSESTKPQAG